MRLQCSQTGYSIISHPENSRRMLRTCTFTPLTFFWSQSLKQTNFLISSDAASHRNWSKQFIKPYLTSHRKASAKRMLLNIQTWMAKAIKKKSRSRVKRRIKWVTRQHELRYHLLQTTAKQQTAMKQALGKHSTGGTCQGIRCWKHQWNRQFIEILRKPLQWAPKYRSIA